MGDRQRYDKINQHADGADTFRGNVKAPGRHPHEFVADNIDRCKSESGEHAANRPLAIGTLVEYAEDNDGEEADGGETKYKGHYGGDIVGGMNTEITGHQNGKDDGDAPDQDPVGFRGFLV